MGLDIEKAAVPNPDGCLSVLEVFTLGLDKAQSPPTQGWKCTRPSGLLGSSSTSRVLACLPVERLADL